MSNVERIDVAVGVLVRTGASGPQCLMSSRAQGRAMSGYWEFPGGKCEPNESSEHALQRELQEELGIQIREPLFWRSLDVDYPHARVRLHLYWVWNWSGELQSREGQSMQWVSRALLDAHTEVSEQRLVALGVSPVLPGTIPLLQWLAQEPWAGRFCQIVGSSCPDFVQDVSWDAQGLLPVIAQEDGTGDVLMVAWMNEAALVQTALRGEAVYYSRSRQRLWHKGEASGHIQRVLDMRLDCDQDVILLRVRQLGHEPGIACHTGRHSCFYSSLQNGQWKVSPHAPVLKDPKEMYGA